MVMRGRRHDAFAAHHLEIRRKCPERILFTCYSACVALLSFEIKKQKEQTLQIKNQEC